MNSVGRVNTLSHTITSRMGVVVLSAEIARVVQLYLELVRKGQNLTQGKDTELNLQPTQTFYSGNAEKSFFSSFSRDYSKPVI